MFKKIIAGAILSLSVTVGTAAQARACFAEDGGCFTYVYCSYHNNGTGGYYLAHVWNHCPL